MSKQSRTSKLLPALMIRYHGRCTDCHHQVIMQRDATRLHFKSKKMKFIHSNGRIIPRATIEHIIRKSDGGSDNMDNLTLLCESCNQKRNQIAINASFVNFL